VVESSGLLNRRRVKSSTGGSNPPLSAIINTLAVVLDRIPIRTCDVRMDVLQTFCKRAIQFNRGAAAVFQARLSSRSPFPCRFLLHTWEQMRIHVQGE
jgi:hypothetical protein